MDESVLAAMGKWPNVPAVFGWLSLDEQGHWRLRGEPITHPGLIAFINRNYDCDDSGQWFFQNGPQRGYVELGYTPWVLHVDSDGRLYTHTGQSVTSIAGVWIDDEGNLLLETEFGIGLVGSDALPRVSEFLVDGNGEPLDEDALQELLDGGASPGACLARGDQRIPVASIARAEVAQRFGFVANPRPEQ